MSNVFIWDVVVPVITGSVELVIWHLIWLRHVYGGMPKQYVSSTLHRRLALPIFVAILLWLLIIGVLWVCRLAIDPYLVKDTTPDIPLRAPILFTVLAAGYWVAIMGVYAWADGICQKYIAPRLWHTGLPMYSAGPPVYDSYYHSADSHTGFDAHHGFDGHVGHF